MLPRVSRVQTAVQYVGRQAVNHKRGAWCKNRSSGVEEQGAVWRSAQCVSAAVARKPAAAETSNAGQRKIRNQASGAPRIACYRPGEGRGGNDEVLQAVRYENPEPRQTNNQNQGHQP